MRRLRISWRHRATAARPDGRPRTGPPSVILVSRADCHLCEDARAVVARVTAEFRIGFEERDVDRDAGLLAAYATLVPVLLVDGVEHAHWHVEESALRSALAAYTP